MFNEAIFVFEILFLFLCTLFAAKKGELFLGTLVCLQALFANLFVLKQISLFGLNVTASDSLAVGCAMGLSVFQEFFGKEKAKKLSILSLISLLFFVVLSLFHLGFKANRFDFANEHYEALLSFSPRIAFASLTAFYFSQKGDIFFFSFLKKRVPRWPLGLRSALSSFSSQVIDTLLFSLLGLLGIVANLAHIFILSLSIKLLFIVCFSSFLLLFKKALLAKDSA